MSITGSLVGYENNNEMCNKRNRSLLNVTASSKQCTSLNSSISNSVITSASSCVSTSKHQNIDNETIQLKGKRKLHLNSLWSIWYGILATYLQGYLALNGAYRFLGCYLIQWRDEPPFTELNLQIFFCGLVFLMLPLFFISTIFKVGNLANDGIKLASGSRKCSAEPQDGLEAEAKGGTLRAIWTHGGPTSAFIHIIIALCLLIPRLLLETRLIENGNLPREHIWRTELDFMLTHRDRLVVLSFMTSPYQNNSRDDDTRDFMAAANNNVLYEKTHLAEKFYPGGFDEMDMFDFDTHEKMEFEAPTSTHRTFVSKIASGSGQQLTNANPSQENNRKTHHERPMKGGHRQNGKSGSGGGGGRKHNNRKDSHHADGGELPRPTNRKEKSNRRGDDIDEKLELRPNKKFDFDRIGDFEVSTVFEAPKNGKKNGATAAAANNHQAGKMHETVEDIPSGHTTLDEEHGRKNVIKDSNIHIVRPMDAIVPSTPLSTDSKIIEIKPSNGRNSGGIKKIKRFSGNVHETNTRDAEYESTIAYAATAGDDDDDAYADEGEFKRIGLNENIGNGADDNTNGVIFSSSSGVQIEAASLIGAVPANISTVPMNLSGLAGSIQRYLHVEKEIDVKDWSRPPSFEFLNLVFALLVWSARYPSVFWGTSKPFATIFSLQMLTNSVDILLGYAGVSVIYKLQIVGMQLPLQPQTGLLLNGIVTLSLYLLSIFLIISSSLILYLYGHGRLSSRVRDRRMISTKSGDTWAYFAHCASLCFILALAVVKAPLMHDFSAIYRGSLDGAVLVAALVSVIHIFLWIVLWLGLTAKRRWNFKLPPLEAVGGVTVTQPLLVSSPHGRPTMNHRHHSQQKHNGEETIYWPSSPKLKVTFNDVPSTLSDHNLAEHDGKRHSGCRTSLCLSSAPGEIDDGDYATLRGPNGDLLLFSGVGLPCDTADDTSEEGKLLESVRDDSVTYASTRDLEPPMPSQPPLPPPPPEPFFEPFEQQQMMSPLAPVLVTVHTNEAHISSSMATMTPRCLRRADSGVPHEALTPRSDSTSTECSTSPPERASSDSSSGVHSGEERDEVVIRPRPPKVIAKLPPQPVIQEEPFTRSTNMVMSSFINSDGKSSATLPISRGNPNEPRYDFNNHCSTMPLPINHQPQHQPQYPVQHFTPSASRTQLHHTTLPNGVRYSNPQHFLRRMPYMQNAESPYGILGLGAGHHTFSKLLHDPLLQNSLMSHVIHEDRDSANYSMMSDDNRDMYMNSNNMMMH